MLRDGFIDPMVVALFYLPGLAWVLGWVWLIVPVVMQ